MPAAAAATSAAAAAAAVARPSPQTLQPPIAMRRCPAAVYLVLRRCCAGCLVRPARWRGLLLLPSLPLLPHCCLELPLLLPVVVVVALLLLPTALLLPVPLMLAARLAALLAALPALLLPLLPHVALLLLRQPVQRPPLAQQLQPAARTAAGPPGAWRHHRHRSVPAQRRLLLRCLLGSCPHNLLPLYNLLLSALQQDHLTLRSPAHMLRAAMV